MNQNKKFIAALSSLILSLLLVVHAFAATVQRSNFIVKNLSCPSCLATIEDELKSMPGALGMNADLRQGRVTVDHLSSINYEQIATTITRLGYPATADWTATVPKQYTNKFASKGSYGSGCSSGGCSTSDGAGPGPTAWKAAPATGNINRTRLQVSNLSCTSCLANIATELSKLSDTYGMNGYLSRGVVIVDHTTTFDNSKIATTISSLGYPAKVIATNKVPAQKSFSAAPNNRSSIQAIRAGIGCNVKGPCNATSASWQKLYNRYFTKKNSK